MARRAEKPAELSERIVARLPTPAKGHRDEYFDGRVKGFGIRVSDKGRKTWFVMYRNMGEANQRRTSIGTYPEVSLAEARLKAQAILLQAKKGELRRPEPATAATGADIPDGATFRLMAAEYMERYSKPNKRSWPADERIIKAELNPLWGDRLASDIMRKEVIELLDRIRDRGAPIQANRTLQTLRKIYNWAIDREIVEVNPCLRVKPVAKENQRDRVLTPDEIKAVWAAFERQDQVVGSMLKIRLFTAQRGGEVESMRWVDLDLAAGWWSIPASKAKNGLSHRVPLSQPVIELLSALHARTGHQEWVFPSPSCLGMHITAVQKLAGRIRSISGIQDMRLHDLRRTAASYMASLGVQRLVISKILNHVEGGVTRIYDRYSYDKEKRDALELWGRELLKTIVNKAGD